MKKSFKKLLYVSIFILILAAGFSGCASASAYQEKTDALFPRHEQAIVREASMSGELTDIAVIDGEELPISILGESAVPPGLTPGKHSLGFYFVQLDQPSAPAAPATTTTTTTRVNSRTTVTTSRTTAPAGGYVNIPTMTRISELITTESDFKPSKIYLMYTDAGKKPFFVDAGFSGWYWEWRLENKKANETVITIEDERAWASLNVPEPFMLLIDGELALWLGGRQQYDIVVSQGSHTFAIIDKSDNPRSETISVSREVNIFGEEMEIDIQGAQKNQFEFINLTAKEKTIAEKELDAKVGLVLKETSSNLPPAPDNTVSPGESILEVSMDLFMSFEMQVYLDKKPIMNFAEDGTLRGKIPNGHHEISIGGYYSDEAEFDADSNLISVSVDVGLFGPDTKIEKKPLR
jgi:hypothetical protein